MVHQDTSPRRYRVQAVQILFDHEVHRNTGPFLIRSGKFLRIKYSAWSIYEKHVQVVNTGIKKMAEARQHAKFLRIVVTSTIGF